MGVVFLLAVCLHLAVGLKARVDNESVYSKGISKVWKFENTKSASSKKGLALFVLFQFKLARQVGQVWIKEIDYLTDTLTVWLFTLTRTTSAA